MRRAAPLILLALLASACAGRAHNIPGTKIADTSENNQIIDVVERYRQAVEAKDAAKLLTMASRQYWEDAGTPSGADDYGYDGLRSVLTTRFQQADAIRYSMKYVTIKVKGDKAYVDVIIDASYSVPTPRGMERRDMRDQNRLVLSHEGGRWLFVSGM